MVRGRGSLPAELESAQLRRLRHIRRLRPERSGHASVEHVRHQLFVGRDTETRADALLKVTSKPGLVYEQNLANEIAILGTINRELPDSRHFPLLLDHGRLADGRLFLLMSLFAEWPLATTIGTERRPDRLVGQLTTIMAAAAALADLHDIGVIHVDLNPMNILYRPEQGEPVIRIVDFESAYDRARHGRGASYNPPTTLGFSAPELSAHAPDARADVFSLGAVLYTMIAGYEWTWGSALSASIAADEGLDPALATVLRTAADPDPDGRYASMHAMRDALSEYLESIWRAANGPERGRKS